VAPSFCKKLALTSPEIGGRSIVIVRLWTQATEFSFLLVVYLINTSCTLGEKKDLMSTSVDTNQMGEIN
jgi:hypothetical protein